MINHIYLNLDCCFRAVHCILDVLTSPEIYYDLLELPTRNSPVPEEIRNNTDFFPWFKDCIGAIDRMHILAHVPEGEHVAYCNWKGDIC